MEVRDILPAPGFAEPVSSLTHLAGAAVFAALAPGLLRRGRGDPVRVACLGVYAFSCVFLLSMSGTYHLLAFGGTARAVLERLDHGAIFGLIAGTFTPVHGILFHGRWRWGPLLFLWAVAAAGITLKTVYFGGLAEWLGLSFYLGLGWAGVATLAVLWRRHGWGFVRLPAWGGLVYTAGAVFEFLRQPVLVPGVVGPHELFHVAVLAGAGLHWRFVSRIAAGEAPPRGCRPG